MSQGFRDPEKGSIDVLKSPGKQLSPDSLSLEKYAPEDAEKDNIEMTPEDKAAERTFVGL
jgi:hypothetical protein